MLVIIVAINSDSISYRGPSVPRAFGTGYLSTIQVRVNSSCRVGKVFFQHEQYADAELPAHLRVLTA